MNPAAGALHRPWRVLIAHNAYRQAGGEDAVVREETALLRDAGHAVIEYHRDNDELDGVSAPRAALETAWSARSYREVAALLRQHRPDVVHVHNTFARISPALYWAAARAGVPVVQTLHNFRLLCPQALLLRDGRVCEDCVGRVPWRAVRHACYRESRAHSAVLAATVTAHRLVGTWTHKVARYIALNEFCRQRFIAGGLPAARVVVKPNFVPEPAVRGDGSRAGGVFVGRLSAEKGIAVLAQALRAVPDVTLDVYGEGPARGALEGLPNCRLHGWAAPAEVAQALSRAAFIVMPSQWYENFPRTLVEAWAAGTPVLASRIGALESLVEEGRTGWLFDPYDSADLARTLTRTRTDPDALARMGHAARAHWQAHFTPEVNLRTLLGIYADARGELAGATPAPAAPPQPGA